MQTRGVPQEPGRSCQLHRQEAGPGNPDNNPTARSGRCARSAAGTKQAGTRVVSEGEGDEARGDGWQEVGVLNSTAEAGEPAPGDPVEGRQHHTVWSL